MNPVDNPHAKLHAKLQANADDVLAQWRARHRGVPAPRRPRRGAAGPGRRPDRHAMPAGFWATTLLMNIA